MKKLYIGNLAYSTTEEELRAFFTEYEPLSSVKIITDGYTGQSRGFGFVEINDDSMAAEAIKNLNGQSLGGKTLTINEARPQASGGGGGSRGFGGKPRSSSGGGGGGSSYGDRRRSSGGSGGGGGGSYGGRSYR